MILVVAHPQSLSFSDSNGYQLKVKIVKGPANLINRQITVEFSASQMDAIAIAFETFPQAFETFPQEGRPGNFGGIQF